jgi:hypothetical protein
MLMYAAACKTNIAFVGELFSRWWSSAFTNFKFQKKLGTIQSIHIFHISSSSSSLKSNQQSKQRGSKHTHILFLFFIISEKKQTSKVGHDFFFIPLLCTLPSTTSG